MEKSYSPDQVEQKWYHTWEEAGYFAPSGKGQPFCIMLPPPNVTGTLHMGHAFQSTLMDVLTRYHRMKGDNTLWQAGTDHAGIATQMVVERQLNQQGKTRQALGREAFTKAVWEWKATSGGAITQQFRRLGASLDWSCERFTMDAHFSEAVTQVFVQLYEEGLIYRGNRLVNWDPVLQTALSDLEVVTTEEAGTLWFIAYPLLSGSGSLTVATTRPETLLGDVAVAVHPADERYQSWIGQTLLLPIANRPIPIIADESVDPAFGTGCVKITPAHDFNDYATAKRHHLPFINILTLDAHLNDNVPPEYRGLERYHARTKVLETLRAGGFLKKEEPYALKVPRGDRSGVVVEPLLTDQWFVKIAPLAAPAIQAVLDGKIRFVPEHWTKTFYEWMNNIQDWCISRQIWWGHRIPAWYDDNGQCYVGKDEPSVRQKFGISADKILTPDPDVLDTWFSSALWPFVTLGWGGETQRLKTFYPTSVLVTGFDIIFFWVARMIMMGIKETGEVPFKEVYIHGLLRDSDGQKMSKSKGNVLDPIDLVDGISLDALVSKRTQGLMRPEDAPTIAAKTKRQFPDGIPAHGTDALRFTFCALASTGRDIRFDLGRLAGYRNFCNKLWNAARYVEMQRERLLPLSSCGRGKMNLADRWITSLLHRTIIQVTENIQHYRFDFAAQALYDFVWREYCDWYVELSKPVLYAEAPPLEKRQFPAPSLGKEPFPVPPFEKEPAPSLSRGGLGGIFSQQTAALHTLVTVLENTLRLLHPLMPFITEEIWQHLGFSKRAGLPTILQAPYPTGDPTLVDEAAEVEIAWLKAVILGVRNIRGEMNLSPGKRLSVFLRQGTPLDHTRVLAHENEIKVLAKIDSIAWLRPEETLLQSATALAGELEILVPLADLLDTTAEKARLNGEIAKLQQALTRTRSKLANSDFIQKAPPAAVQKEQERLRTDESALAKLEKQLAVFV